MLIIAFSGIAFYAPTALKGRYVPLAFIDVAAWLDVFVIGGVSVTVIAVMLVSVNVVLKMEDAKKCAPGGDLVESAKTLKTIFNDEACAVLFNSQSIDDDQDIGLVAPRHFKDLGDLALSVVPTSRRGVFDINYRGQTLSVDWLVLPDEADGRLGQADESNDTWQSLRPFNLAVIDVECDASNHAFAGGKVILTGGATFINPPGGVIGQLSHSLADFAFQMNPAAAQVRPPEDIVNTVEEYKDSWIKFFLGEVCDRLFSQAVAHGDLHTNADGWFLAFPHWHTTASLFDAFDTLLNASENDVAPVSRRKARVSDLNEGRGGRARFNSTSSSLDKDMDISGIAARTISSRLNMESSVDKIEYTLRSMDIDDDGVLTRAELKASLASRKGVFRGGIHQKVLSAFQQLLSRTKLINTLQNALHSLFLFNERQMYTRTLSIDFGGLRFNYGKRLQWLLLGNPLHSTIAQVARLNVLELSQKLGNPGPLEYTCLWLDLKATDEERMLVLGLFEVLSQVKNRTDTSTLREFVPVVREEQGCNLNANPSALFLDTGDASPSPKKDGSSLWKVFRRSVKRSNRLDEVELSELPHDRHALDCPSSAPPTAPALLPSTPEESEELHELPDSESDCGGGLSSCSDDEPVSPVVRTSSVEAELEPFETRLSRWHSLSGHDSTSNGNMGDEY